MYYAFTFSYLLRVHEMVHDGWGIHVRGSPLFNIVFPGAGQLRGPLVICGRG